MSDQSKQVKFENLVDSELFLTQAFTYCFNNTIQIEQNLLQKYEIENFKTCFSNFLNLNNTKN